jgi:hypothetical protein
MRAIIRPVVAAVSIACMSLPTVPVFVGCAFAQEKQPDASQEALKQVALTEKQLEGLIATKSESDAIIAKLPEGDDNPDPKVMAQLDAVAKKHGFANYAEYGTVFGNVSLVMGGFDPDTNKYVGEEAVLKKQIAEIQADKKMSPKDKKEALSELNESLKAITPVQFPANIVLVTKYYDKLSPLMSQDQQ